MVGAVKRLACGVKLGRIDVDSVGVMAQPIRVHTFPPGGGLPTIAPFGLKLAMAMRLGDIPYELVIDSDPRNSPKRSVPWIELGEVKMADSALILNWLRDTRGLDLDRGLAPVERARGLALRALLEDHWHQVFSSEMMFHPGGLASKLPPDFLELVKRHLYERGVLRHDKDEIAALGREDLDAVAAWLDGREWAVADHPTVTDCSVWGLLAPAFYVPLASPCFSYARSLPSLRAFIERARERCFPDLPPPPRPG